MPPAVNIRKAAAADWPQIWAMLEPVLRAADVYALPQDWREDDARSHWFHPSNEVFVANAHGNDPEQSSSEGTAHLLLSLPENGKAPKVRAGDNLTASVTLKDGRVLSMSVNVAPARPAITLLNKRIGQAPDAAIRLKDPNDLPANQQLIFSLKSSSSFPRTGKIEIANADDSLHTMLDVASGTLVLQNHHTLVGTLDPLKAFGTSAFGPLRLRAVTPDGIAGDWIPLITLVRLPTLDNVHCPSDASQPCTVAGSSLYLVDSIATDADFTNPTEVPEGFIGTALSLPRPSRSGFYLRLRDDPVAANTVTVPVIVQRAVPVAQKAPPAIEKPELPTPDNTAPATDTQPATVPPTKSAAPSSPEGAAGQSSCAPGPCAAPAPAVSAPTTSPSAKS